jgi:uncharacterized LabA/DUF88 family protein
MINLHDYVAILIDADNAQLKYIEHVVKIAEYYGKLEICSAYGDWQTSQLSGWCETLDALKISRIQVDRVGKNATDNRLLLDAGSILSYGLMRNAVRVFVLVSGDGDFASACQAIQESGRQVIGIGNGEITSKSLENVCDEFYYLEDLEHELSELKKRYPIPPNEVRAFWKMLHFVYIKFYETQVEWITLSELGNKLREVKPDYESRFGDRKLSEWLSNFDWYLEINGQVIRRNPKYIHYTLLAKSYLETQRRFDTVSLTQFGKVLRELNPDYKSQFGNRKLSDWLKDYPDVFNINDNLVTLTSRRITIFS